MLSSDTEMHSSGVLCIVRLGQHEDDMNDIVVIAHADDRYNMKLNKI